MLKIWLASFRRRINERQSSKIESLVLGCIEKIYPAQTEQIHTHTRAFLVGRAAEY